jgi:Fe-S oxidoreductase
MALARSLDGVISGEHGIGITKLEYLTDDETGAFWRLQAAVDPEGRFNARQADEGRRPRNAYTPSFNLLGTESLIMEQSAIGRSPTSIKDCLRCGKCKPVCATHVPRANLLYSPRNKILATSLLIEAFLYEEQTRRGVSLRHFDEFERRGRPLHRVPQVREALPGRHRLRRRVDRDAQPAAQAGQEAFNPGTAAAMAFLNATDPATIKLMRAGMIGWGYKAQRLGTRHRQGARADPGPVQHPPPPWASRRSRRRSSTSSTSRCRAAAQAHVPRAARHRGRAVVPVIRDPKVKRDESDAVFYFPGCGSERLFSQVGLATQAMLYQVGARPCCRRATCAAATRRPPAARRTRASRSPPTTACCSTASPTRSTISTSRP